MTFLKLDLQTKKNLLVFLSCLFFWWVLSAAGICSASGMPEPTYQAMEAELQGLEARLNRLAQISNTQQTESKRLQEQLTKSEAELKTLKTRLDTSNQQLTQAQNSLANANQLLDRFAQEEKRTRLRIKAQRNAWIVATITAIIVAVSS